LFFVLREPEKTQGGPMLGETVHKGHWAAIFGSRNVVLCMVALLCAMSCIFVLGGMLPNYLIDYLHLTPQQMGFVSSALGFGGFIGQFGVPGLSDMLGRRPVAIISFVGAAVTVYLFSKLGPNPTMLFGMMFLVSFFSLGNVALITGPIATESAPPGLVTSAIGLVVGAGEIFGGGVAPVMGGYVAQHFGIQNILLMPLVGVALGALVCLGLKETAPSKIGAPSPSMAHS